MKTILCGILLAVLIGCASAPSARNSQTSETEKLAEAREPSRASDWGTPWWQDPVFVIPHVPGISRWEDIPIADRPHTPVWQGVPPGDTPLKQLVAESSIIAYGRLDTNGLHTLWVAVTEVWRGLQEASAVGITNGMQFPLWRAYPPPEGAVLFFQRVQPSSEVFWLRSTYAVRAGRVGGMSIQEFKEAFDL
jgi:hypothetical protein